MPENNSPIYSYIRKWFEYSFANAEHIRPIHAAIYLWHVELNNRMGWAEKFASPATQTMAACGISHYNTYKKAFDELVDWGFILIVKKSYNQHQSNIVALSKNIKADAKPLKNAIAENIKATVKANAEQLTEHLQHNNTNIPETDIPINNFSSGKPDDATLEFLKEADTMAEKTEKKKSAAKKEKAPAPEFWQALVDTWFVFYEENFQIKPTFKGPATKALKEIVAKLKILSVNAGYKWDEAYAKKVLLHFLRKSIADPWRKSNFLLHILNSHFDAIIQHNGTKQSNNNNTKGQQQFSASSVFQQFSAIHNGTGKPE